MREELQDRARDLLRRAGLAEVPRGVVVGALMLVVAAVGVAAWRALPSRDSGPGFALERGAADGGAAGSAAASGVTTPAGSAAVTASPSADTSEAAVWVHVVGAVRHPGLYGLPVDSRVEGAIEAAGGALGNAATEAVNLARKVADGEQVVIPTQDEARKGIGLAGVAPSAAADAGSAGGAAAGAGPVDINSATAEQLDALPGIGPATAGKIVADRSANGRFTSVDDLGRVSGIGPKKLDALKELICAR